MSKLTENQIEYVIANQEDFNNVPVEKQGSLLQKSSDRWFTAMKDFFNNKPENLSEEEQETLDKLIGTGIFFAYQYQKGQNKEGFDEICHYLTEYSDLKNDDINEAMDNYETLTAVEEEEPELGEGEEPKVEAPKTDNPEVQAQPKQSKPLMKENTRFGIELFDYFRAKNHFEKRNPVSQFFSKLVGKLFKTGEHYILSLKEDYMQTEYDMTAKELDDKYRFFNQKNTLDHFSTDDVDYTTISATNEEVNDFKARLEQDTKEPNPEKTSQQVETSQPQVTKELK